MQRALRLCHAADDCQNIAGRWTCQLYTDGSAKNYKAGWAVTIIWQHREAGLTCLGGAFGDALQTTQGSPGRFGNIQADSLQAEQVAIIWALLWILQVCDCMETLDEVAIWFDNIAAGQGASGDMGLPQGSGLSKTARGLAQLVSQVTGGKLRFGHVPARTGHPWNELSDAMAKHAAGIVVQTGLQLQ